MAKLGVFSVALLWICLAGHAEDSRDLSALTFWPQPLSAPVLPLGPRNPVSDATHGSGVSERGAPREDAQQPESREELTAAVAAQLDGIEAEQAQSGERSPELIAKLTALASTYLKLGDPASADAALEHAIEIARINFGLHSLDQAEVVESLVATRQTSGDYGGAAEKRRYLRELVGRNSDDPRVVGILTEMAAQEMGNARRLVGMPARAKLASRRVSTASCGSRVRHLRSPRCIPRSPTISPRSRRRCGRIRAMSPTCSRSKTRCRTPCTSSLRIPRYSGRGAREAHGTEPSARRGIPRSVSRAGGFCGTRSSTA